PERSTSATPAMVSSSMSGRVIGRNGAAGFTGAVAEAGNVVGAVISGLVTEKRVVGGLGEQMFSKGRVGEQRAHIALACDHKDATGLLPNLPKLCLVHEAPARPRRRI